MDRRSRWNDLLEILAARKQLSVEDAASELGVSAATIRRDFDELAQQQMLTRTRGGAVVSGVTYDLPMRYKASRQAEEKQRIAAAAAAMVPARSVVGINGGTTTTEVARALSSRSDLVDDRTGSAITIVTNALNIAYELILRPNVRVVLTGGVARPQSYELVGSLAEPVLRRLSLDIIFLGVDAFSVQWGACTQNDSEASVNRLLVERAEQVVVVADSSKLGRRAFTRICEAGKVAALVTDTAATDEQTAPFEALGLRLVRA
jgi:DeoR/GlpR family transcriptional regulator of sugar metabolism